MKDWWVLTLLSGAVVALFGIVAFWLYAAVYIAIVLIKS